MATLEIYDCTREFYFIVKCFYKLHFPIHVMYTFIVN